MSFFANTELRIMDSSVYKGAFFTAVYISFEPATKILPEDMPSLLTALALAYAKRQDPEWSPAAPRGDSSGGETPGIPADGTPGDSHVEHSRPASGDDDPSPDPQSTGGTGDRGEQGEDPGLH
jgi:hypothetical protein